MKKLLQNKLVLFLLIMLVSGLVSKSVAGAILGATGTVAMIIMAFVIGGTIDFLLAVVGLQPVLADKVIAFVFGKNEKGEGDSQ